MMVWKMIITALFAVAVNSGRKKRKLWTKGMKQRRSEEAALRMGRNKGKVHGLPLHVSGSSSRVQRDIAGRRHVSRSEVVIQPSQFQESASTPSDSLTHDLVGAAQPIEQTHITPVVDGVGLVPQELLSKMGTESRDIGTGFQSTVDGMQYSSALNLYIYDVFISLFRAQNQPVCLLEAVVIPAQEIWMVLLDQLDKPTTLVD